MAATGPLWRSSCSWVDLLLSSDDQLLEYTAMLVVMVGVCGRAGGYVVC